MLIRFLDPASWELLIGYAVSHNQKRGKKKKRQLNYSFSSILISAFVNGCVTAQGYVDLFLVCAYLGEGK